MTWYCRCLRGSEHVGGEEPFELGSECIDCSKVFVWERYIPDKLTEPEVCKALEAPMIARLFREGYLLGERLWNPCPRRCREDHDHVRVPRTQVFLDGSTLYREAIHLPARENGDMEVLVFERKVNARRTRTEAPLSSGHKKQLNYYALLNKKFSGVPSPQESEYLLSRKL